MMILKKLNSGMRGFLVSTQFDSDIRKRIDIELSKTRRLHNDDNTYGWTMLHIHDIARLGWNEYVDRYIVGFNAFLEQQNSRNYNYNNVSYISETK